MVNAKAQSIRTTVEYGLPVKDPAEIGSSEGEQLSQMEVWKRSAEEQLEMLIVVHKPRAKNLSKDLASLNDEQI